MVTLQVAGVNSRKGEKIMVNFAPFLRLCSFNVLMGKWDQLQCGCWICLNFWFASRPLALVGSAPGNLTLL